MSSRAGTAAACATAGLVPPQGGEPVAWSEDDRLKAQEALLQTQHAADALISIDAGGLVLAWNAGAERLFGYARAQMIGQPLHAIIPARLRHAHDSGVQRISAGSAPRHEGENLEAPALRADGTEFPAELAFSQWQRGGQSGFTAVVRDISQRRQLEAEVLSKASTEPLTGLGNRSWFLGKLEQVRNSLPTGSCVSALSIDLDRFTHVNASLGPAMGDLILKQVAERLLAAIGPSDFLARFGGDDFAVLLTSADQAEALRTAERLRTVIQGAGAIDGITIALNASIGISTHTVRAPGRDRTAHMTLLRNASLALDAARNAGGGQICAYRPAMHTRASRQLTLHGHLRDALERNQLAVAYQPLVDLSTGRAKGAEALLRWNHPRLGPVGPAEFIPVAENTGLVGLLGAWVLRQACAEAASWPTDSATVSVNVSGRQLADDQVLRDVQDALEGSGLSADRLVLEVTESVLTTTDTTMGRRLQALRRLGCRLAIDDFGTGYSSLAALAHLPVDELKIDKSFVNDITRRGRSLRLVHSIIALGQSLGMTTLAEGIETPAQRALLTKAGCGAGQGYLFSRPVPPEQLPQLLSRPLG